MGDVDTFSVPMVNYILSLMKAFYNPSTGYATDCPNLKIALYCLVHVHVRFCVGEQNMWLQGLEWN